MKNKQPIKPKTTPIYQTSVFTFDDLNELEAYFEQPNQRYMYSRYGNPNSDELAEEVNRLEGGDGALVTSSGMSAILTAILTFCQSGDHVLCAEEIYGGASTLLSSELSRMGITVTYVPMESLSQLDSYVLQNSQLLLIETISNPLLKVQDIKAIAKECQSLNLRLIVDNTFPTPVMTRPLELGADVVLHSVTKYLSGHSDVTAGVIITKGEFVQRVREIVMHYGLNLSPFDSWLASRGLKTLNLRMKQHCQNALILAHFLEEHPKVRKVCYPGLLTHPNYSLAKEQGHDLFGGMLSFYIEDDLDTVNRFMKGLKNIPFAPSLAGVQTSISYPLKASHRSLSPEQLERLGITTGLIRLSVGIEDPEELQQDLEQALNSL
jgi:cystathionine beta-lyase/cystathionine gamma-synthase